MKRNFSRRDFLRLTSIGALAAALPWTLEGCGDGESPVPFFSSSERATLEAAAERILPPQAAIGPLEAGAVDYIEGLLTAFEYNPPRIFAGGPYSGRRPYPDNATGRPSQDYPPNSFDRFLPLSRVKEIAWRVRLYGSDSVPGGDFNDAVLAPTLGLRTRYSEGVQQLDAKAQELFAGPFSALTPELQDEALLQSDRDFAFLLTEHLLEGMYGDPAYGGNRDESGWRSVGFDGDSQPLGFSIYDASTGTYKERAGAPLSGPNPSEDYAGFDDEVLELVANIVSGTGGKRFS
ncbi:MAG: gluconate 2-dehydrogenase subunit 3 family protein [Dehalococcoidia bacterium]